MKKFLRQLASRLQAPGRRPGRAPTSSAIRPRLEALEDRQLLSITDLTGVAQLFPRHSGPTILYVNFDGNTGEHVSSFQSTTGDRTRDIQEILYRTSEIFAPFDVQVRRMYGNGVASTSNGNTTVFIGDDTDNGTGASNGSYAFTYFANCDYPGSIQGIHHQPNSNAYDVAYVDPVYGASSYSWTNTQIAQGIAHEAGHTFGLAHVLSSPYPEIMSYDATNTRFINRTFNITDLNNTGTSLVHDARLVPQWYQRIYFGFGYYDFPVNIVTQNSYTYLQAVLGARSTAGDFANVADASAVDSTYLDGSTPSIGVGSNITAYLQQTGDYDVYQLSSSYTRFVQIDVTRPAGSTVDPVVMIFDSTGRNLLAFNDDGGGYPNSRLIFNVAAGGNYKVVVGAYGANSSGQYQLTVNNYYFVASPLYASMSLALQPTLTLSPTNVDLGGSAQGMSAGAAGAAATPVSTVFQDFNRFMPQSMVQQLVSRAPRGGQSGSPGLMQGNADLLGGW